MKILDRLSVLRVMFPAWRGSSEEEDAAIQNAAKKASYEAALRWTRAFRQNPELADDLIIHSRLATLDAVSFEDGVEVPDKIDPYRLAYEKGQHDLAVKLITLMGVTTEEIRTKLMEVEYDYS